VVIALRFSRPLRVETVDAATVLLSGPEGVEAARVVAAENGRLAFVTPEAPLLLGAAYTLSINGATDPAGVLIPPTVVTFKTEGSSASGGQGASAQSGSGRAQSVASESSAGPNRPVDPTAPVELDEAEWRGERRDGKPHSHWQELPPLSAPPGVTALAGQVLRLNGQPLAGATLRIGTRAAQTDRTGRFLLTNIPAGAPLMFIDGSTANRPGRTYARFIQHVDITAGATNVLPYTIWLALIDTQHTVSIPVPTPSEMVVTTPRAPGLEMRIPAGVILRHSNGEPVTEVSLTRIPTDRPPFPLPEGTDFFFTPELLGAHVELPDGTESPNGVRFILLNYRRLAPGVRLNLWDYDPVGAWTVYGQGTVMRDGRQIMPDPGVQFFRVGCAFPLGAEGTVPATNPPIAGIRDVDPVDLATGLFVREKTDLVIQDVIPIVVRRVYRQSDTSVRPFGIGQTHSYQIYLAGDNAYYQYADLVLADGGKVHYTRTSPGTDLAGAIMQHIGTPTAFYKSILTRNTPRPGWDLTFADGSVWQFIDANPGAALSAIRDRHGNQLTIERVSAEHVNQNVKRVVSPNGRWVEFSYTAPNSVIVSQIKDNAGRTVTYGYDAQVRLTSVTDPAGGVTQSTWDAINTDRLLTITDARGITSLTNEYDAAGRVARQTFADGTSYQFAYTLDVNGKIIQTDVTNPRGYVRRLTFNADGYALTDTRAQGTALAQTMTYTRDTANRVTAAVDALSRRTEYTYDAQGNVLTVTRLAGTADAVTTAFTYEPTFNQVATVTDPLSHTTTFGYDAQGNLTSLTNPLGQQTTLTYNTAGQPLTVTTPAGTTSFAYDLGELVSTTDPTGRTASRATDSVGRVIAMTNPLGQRSRYEYNVVNRLTKVIDPLGGTTQFSHDPIGNLLSVTDARGNVTSYAYNNMGRRVTRTDPLLRAESYTHDAVGNLATVTDRKSQVTSRTYDALDRLTQVTYADNSTTTYTWDAGDRLTQLTDSLSGTITRTYDGLDRLTQEQTPQGTVSYTYDAAGRRTSLTVGIQPTITYGYDNANRLVSITQGTNIVTYAYDSAGRRTNVTLPNGVTTEYAYDGVGRITGLTYKNGPTILGTLTYAYDGNGVRHAVGGSWARTGLPQPVASATYDAANRQLIFDGQTLTYDFNGNLTSDGASTYTWDVRDRLAELSNAGMAASFQYDAVGRRIGKTFNGTATTVLHDGIDAAEESDGTTVRNIVSGLHIDEYLSHASTSGESRFALVDALGSTIALVDGSGTIVTEYAYEPFGATTSTGAPSENRAQYTGRENDDTQVYFYRARYYHPKFQRFVSEDPIGFAGGDVNLYTYVRNSPVERTDPLGLSPFYPRPEITGCLLFDLCTGWTPQLDCPDSSPLGVFTCESRQADPPGVPRIQRTLVAVDDIALGLLIGAGGALVLELMRQNGVFDFDWSFSKSEDERNPTDEPTVADVLKGKKGSIKQAPLPPGSPSWDDILDKPMKDIDEGAKRGLPGYREIRKLLRGKEYDK
jgi:RHS repeat-associated protein